MDIHDNVFILFWRTMNAFSVRYIMVGGFAVNIQGFNRSTDDMDVWVEDTPMNRENLAKALEKMKIVPKGMIQKMDFVPGWTQMTLPGGFPLDIMTGLKGMEHFSFEECLNKATHAEIEGVLVPFLQINHLLVAKQASNRNKDRMDIEELERIISIQKRKESEK